MESPMYLLFNFFEYVIYINSYIWVNTVHNSFLIDRP